MKKFLWILVLSFVFFLPNVNAACNYQEDARLKGLASNVFTSYDYHADSNTFSIVITNLHPDIYIYDTVKKQFYYYNGSSTIVTYGYAPGQTVKFNIQSNYSNCRGTLQTVHYVNLPFYNQFYQDPICEGLDEYSLCQKWTTHGINKYEDFIKEVSAYKLSLEQDIVIEEPIIDSNVESSAPVVSFLLKYYYIILIMIIVVCLSLMYYLTKKDSFNF